MGKQLLVNFWYHNFITRDATLSDQNKSNQISKWEMHNKANEKKKFCNKKEYISQIASKST